MYRRDRVACLALLTTAGVAWLALGYVLTTLDPVGNASVLLSGALLLGAALTLTIAPVLWLLGFARARRIAYRGAWWVALRRGLLVGLVASLLVLLAGQETFSLPLAAFIAAMALLVELTLSLRR